MKKRERDIQFHLSQMLTLMNPVFCSSDLNIPNQGSVVAPRDTCDAPHVFEAFLSLAPTSLKTKVFAPQQFSVSITHFLRTKR